MFVNGIAFNADNVEAMNYRSNIISISDNKLINDSIFIHGRVYEDYDIDTITAKDGSFAFLKVDYEIIFGRDALGTKPLYYSLSNGLKIASDARALREPEVVETGVLYKYSNGLRKIDLNPLREIKIIEDDEEDIKRTILRLLIKSIERRKSRSLIGVSGIDSLILAEIAKDKAAMVCMRGSDDYNYAKKISSIDLDIILLDDKIDAVKNVINILPFKDPMNISIGTIFYILAKYAKENGYDSIMLGQLADELFGGYARYLSIDSRELNNVLYKDVINAWRINFIRDEMVTSPFTDLILPYTSLDLVRYVLGLKAEMKIRNKQRKFILREVAKMLGIEEIREKRAVQFSSGIYKMIKRLI